MAPEKTDPEGDTVVNTSNVSEDSVVGAEGEPDPYFEPVVNLPEVVVKTNEEEEEEMLKLRCKLYRYHAVESPAEWKERGTGDVKILKHKNKKSVRVLMRQDKTLKIRANHYITPFMELKPNCGSDRAWVWSVAADFADEEPKQELFAIRFANAENARIFKEKFDDARGIVTVAKVTELEESKDGAAGESSESESTDDSKSKDDNSTAQKEEEDKNPDNLTKDLGKLTVKDDDQKE